MATGPAANGISKRKGFSDYKQTEKSSIKYMSSKDYQEDEDDEDYGDPKIEIISAESEELF